MKEKRKEQRLFFLSILFMMLFSFPFAKIMNGPHTILGMPQLYFYIFVLWLTLIFLTWLIADKRQSKKSKNKHE
jgi:hypothetical protein